MASHPRPWWMTALAVACLATIAFTLYRDLTIPDVRDTEVWFGFEVTGWMARATAPIHYAIFALGAWAFWTQRPWALAAGASYLVYTGVSHVVWCVASPHGHGLALGVLYGVAISALAVPLLRLRRRLAP